MTFQFGFSMAPRGVRKSRMLRNGVVCEHRRTMQRAVIAIRSVEGARTTAITMRACSGRPSHTVTSTREMLADAFE